ncbi:sensor domain-containing diguanylate cyclase [Ferrimonas senticii]|uniref:sensor domain-containing diguanylate cyclase n=1 Tax=Ferrimonas senticii TaxID=394566 RepID=UPI0004183677|nr:sensor domain-containing diguanylate cyclase [Ferrimonas senticii]
MSVSDSVNFGVVIHRAFKPLWADDRFLKMYKFESLQQLLGNASLLTLIEPQSHADAVNNYYRLMSGEVAPAVRRSISSDRLGNCFAILTVEHFVEFDGEPALQITIIDISASERRTQKLRDSRSKYRNLILSSHQGIVIHRNFVPLLVNDAYAQLVHAKSAQEVLSWPSLMRIIPEESHAEAFSKYHSVIKGERFGAHSIVETHCVDGSIKMFELYENAVDWDGEPAVLVVYHDITEKHHLQQQLAYQASHDDLTGCLNRQALAAYVMQFQQQALPMSCLMIDIDNFKAVNDNHGHAVGDQVIAKVAATLLEQFSDHGKISRWGGEEFLVVLPNCREAQATELAEQLRHEIEQQLYPSDQGDFSVSLSIGLSTNDRSIPFDFEQQVRLADLQLYVAKHSGKNRVCIHH